jgi:hypothetical protein
MKVEKNMSHEIGKEIVRQIVEDPVKTCIFWGIQSKMLIKDGVMLNIVRGTKVIITLNKNDFYDIELGRVYRGVYTSKKSLNDIDASVLVKTINSLL